MLRKNEKEVLEIENTVVEIKNIFTRLITTLDIIVKKTSAQTNK